MEWENEILSNTLKSFYDVQSASLLQIENFNYFIHHRLTKLIEDESLIEVRLNDRDIFKVTFDHVFVDKPYVIDENRELRYIYPTEARFRELNYSGSIFADIKTCVMTTTPSGEVVESNPRIYHKKIIAKIPIMVQSSRCNLFQKTTEERVRHGECKYDPGGYFIIKGKERVLVSQERMNYNIVYVFEQKPSSKFQMIAEIRSMSEETRHSVFVQMKINGKKIVLQLPYIQQEILLGVVYRAYGFSVAEIEIMLKLACPYWESNKTIESYIHSIILDAQSIETQENAIHHICEYSLNTIMKERKQKYIIQILTNELFPHLGMMSLREHKGMFLANMFHKLISTYIGKRKMDDRDHINNKRIELSGYLICELFRTLFKRFVRTVEPQLEKRQDIIVITNRLNMITLGINHCFATGNWGVPKSSYIRCGVSQILSRLTFTSFCSHLRRILIPIGKEGKNTKVRQIHTSQIGFIDPHETPEGQQSGIVKNMTPFTSVSLQFNMTFLREILDSNEFIETRLQDIFQHIEYLKTATIYFVFINGNLIGYTRQVEKCWKQLVLFQKQNLLPHDVSFSMSDVDKEIHIFSDEGRLQRCLFPRNNFPTLDDIRGKTFTQLVKEKKIIYLDSYQIENETIAMTPSELFSKDYYTYCEIHPSVMSGLCVSLIPFNEHTQSPRITYHASMGKQAIGLPFSNLDTRVDTMCHVLSYPEKPITQSHHAEFNCGNKLPFGNNLIVAILTYTGFNQEDSVIMNRSAIDRGLFRSFSYKMIVIEEKKKSTLMMERIELVPPQYQNRSYDYSKLDTHGVIKTGCYVGVGDVLVSKLQKLTDKMNNDNWHDNSVTVKSGEEGFVDRVYILTNTEGYKIIKVKIRNYKIPEIGDKVASRCAQKGTVSVVLNHEDMPFTESGIVPDLIINPLCIPSRMTINQLIESYGNKLAMEDFSTKYCTSFSHHSLDIIPKLYDELKQLGLDEYGTETMFNGMTGEPLESKIFIGPTYYHRLKHLVSSKIHARNHGNIQALTRQPLEGRSRDGGLRFGEMERDTLERHSPITVSFGVSVPLYQLEFLSCPVYGWNRNKKGIVSSMKTNFLDKGFKDCLEITLFDGRTITCTPDHPMLLQTGQWRRAKFLSKNDALKVCVHLPEIDLEKESLDVNEFHENRNSIFRKKLPCYHDLFKTFLFFRFVTLFHIVKHIPLFLTTVFDFPVVHCDLKYLNKSISDFVKDPVLTFSELKQHRYPRCVEREILSTYLSYFTECCISDDTVRFEFTIPIEDQIFITQLLFRFGIQPYFNVVDETHTKGWLLEDDIIAYHKLIGFRYQTKKVLRMELLSSFLRSRQYYTTLTFEKYLTIVHGNNSYKNEYLLYDTVPTFCLPIRQIQDVGSKHVCDIQVDKTNSFLANGIVAHNCMISHGVSRFLRERLFDVSDYFEIYTCACGNIPHSQHYCNRCEKKDIVKVPIPFACKLLFQELIALGIKIQIKPKLIS